MENTHAIISNSTQLRFAPYMVGQFNKFPLDLNVFTSPENLYRCQPCFYSVTQKYSVVIAEDINFTLTPVKSFRILFQTGCTKPGF